MEVTPKNDINGHISQEILSQLVQKESFVLKSLDLENHLKKCQRCNEIVNIKNYLQQIAGRTKPTENKSHPQRSDLHEKISRIYDSSLTKQEAADFLHHISSCSQCFEYVGFVLEDSLTPVPEEIEKQIDSLTNVSLADMVLSEVPPQESLFKKILSNIKKSVEKIKEAILPPYSQPQPGSVWAIRTGMPITLVAAIALAIFLLPTEPSAFVYDDDPPFPYSRSGFRGTSVPIGQDPNYIKFHNSFSSAAIVYMELDYENYIRRMANLEPIALDLKTKPLKKEQLDEIRDFYFYYGVAHFALSRSEIHDPRNEQHKAEHSENAILNLKEAQSVAAANGLAQLDRDTYFLGLAYGFGGQRENAVSQLQQIERGNHRFEEAVKLIEEWSEE